MSYEVLPSPLDWKGFAPLSHKKEVTVARRFKPHLYMPAQKDTVCVEPSLRMLQSVR
jgi:hypothetical protein